MAVCILLAGVLPHLDSLSVDCQNPDCWFLLAHWLYVLSNLGSVVAFALPGMVTPFVYFNPALLGYN